MYSGAFCRVYNEFGWNYFPEAFGEQLLEWLKKRGAAVKSSLDLGCGTGVLCEILSDAGIRAHGMDLSEGMISVAKQRRPEIAYEVADMITYRPNERFDLVTCTGDALNHILSIEDIDTVFQNVYGYLNPGGYFIFDLLNEREVAPNEPIDLDFSESIRARFLMTLGEDRMVELKISVYENGALKFEEAIHEKIHDPELILSMLEKSGFRILQCADQLLLGGDTHGATWFIVAQKPE